MLPPCQTGICVEGTITISGVEKGSVNSITVEFGQQECLELSWGVGGIRKILPNNHIGALWL